MSSAQTHNGLFDVVVAMLVLTSASLALRFFARFNQRLPIKADDIFAILGWVTFIGASVCALLLLQWKFLGYTKATKPLRKSDHSSKLQISWDLIGTASLACTKLSAIFFYRRIFCVGGRKTWFDYATIGASIVVVLWLAAFNIVAGLQCGTHFAALWNGQYNKYCTHSFAYLLGLAITDLLLDIFILVLPIPRTLQLKTSLSKRLSIIGVFLLAFVGLGASIARMVTFINILDGGTAYYKTHDAEGASTQAVFTTMLEMGISLMAVNLPSLWMLFTHVLPEKVSHGLRSVASISSIRSRRSGSSGRSNGSNEKGHAKSFSDASSRPSESSAYYNDVESQRHMTKVYAAPRHNVGSQQPPENSIRVQNSVSFERDGSVKH